MSAERTSCPYCWHYDCAGHTPAVAAAATAMRGDGTQLDWPTCTGLAELVSAAGLLVDRLPGESRKGDTAPEVAPVVWRVIADPEDYPTAIGHRYRWHGDTWQVWLEHDAEWVRSLWSGLAEMLAAGYRLEEAAAEFPPAQSGEATA